MMAKFFRTSFLIVVLLIAIGMTAAYAGRYYLLRWAANSSSLSEPLVISLDSGTSLSSFAHDLEASSAIDHALLFHLWVKIFGDYRKFQAGTYRFENSIAPSIIAAKVVRGDTWEPVVVQFTVPEGFTMQKIANRLEAIGIGDSRNFLKLATDETFLTSLKIPSTTAEGYLYPATYPFTARPDLREAITVMVETFWDKLPEQYEAQVKEKGLSLNEAVTFASLIELETRLPEEKPIVSEVIWRRLNKKVALAIDASIIYGIPDYDGNLKTHHLKDKANPYNSRTHRGLPPTPIGSPDRSSLVAVLNPTDFGYFYYVLDLKHGSKHRFSKSLKEHNRYVRELIQERRRQRLAARAEKVE